ncbi:MAG: FHA domain-containing protein [Bacteriovoracaceae bacterium]|jgi:hypothetical protein|nr:FHA domain-containing protein [Bacteriovoracaceae bacterium]
MDLRQENKQSFELFSEKGKDKGLYVNKKRVLVGSSEACDVIIPHRDVSGIHAVIETTLAGFKVFDMNSTNGTFVNGSKQVAVSFEIGDLIKFGTQEFVFKVYSKKDVPPILDMLDPELPSKIKSRQFKSLPDSPDNILDLDVDYIVPRVEYPLGKDPKAEFSEYIFEDVETLYPIFNYNVHASSVEVIILFRGEIYSVDYLPNKKNVYQLVGKNASGKQIEFAQLGISDRVNFIEVNKQEVIVHTLDGYTPKLWTDESDTLLNEGPVNLYDDDILKLDNGDLQIFIRLTPAPPGVASAPIFRKDKEFKKYLFLMFLLVFSFLTVTTLFEVDPDLDEEKAPERIATILYKKPVKKVNTKKITKKIVKKVTKKKVNKVVKKVANTQSKSRKNVNKTKVKVKTIVKTVTKVVKTTKKLKKVKSNKAKKTRIKRIVRRRILKGKGSKKTKRRTSRSANRRKKSKGRVDTYKSFDFKSTMSNLLSKSGSTKTYQAATNAKANSFNTGANSVGGTSSTLRASKVKNRLGSLTGATNGKVDSSRGLKGIISKKSQYFAGLPYKTVHLGGMDPDMIRKILMEHIPQFRSCYQKVLAGGIYGNFQGVVKLDFIIGASGHVTKAGIEAADDAIPSKVKSCVINTLKGISFPEPTGGGVVEVSQPMNFYPRR